MPGICAAVNADYFELRIVAKANIEIVKIPPRRAHDENTLAIWLWPVLVDLGLPR